MKICWFGIYDPLYPRNSVLLSGVRENGVEVIECREDWKDPHRYRKLAKRLRALLSDKQTEIGGQQFDIIYAAYPAPVPAILAKLIVWMRKISSAFNASPSLATQPLIVMDAFYSMYDAVVNDRREIPWFHPRALKLLFIDWLALMLADAVIVDTKEHKKYWSRWLFANPKKIHVVYLGADPKRFGDQLIKGDSQFHEQLISNSSNQSANQLVANHSTFNSEKPFIVHFSGKYIPLQGIEKIVEAARVLENDPSIKFVLLGWKKGDRPADKLIQKYDLKNVERIERVPLDEYNKRIGEADIMLGIFGDTAKATRVIPNKVFEAAAAGKPTITMDTPAVREIFSDDDMLLIPNDPALIASAITRLKEDTHLRRRLSDNCRRRIENSYTPIKIGRKLIEACASF